MEIENADVSQVTETIKNQLVSLEGTETIPTFDQVIFGDANNIRAEVASLRRELDVLKRKEIHFFRDIESHHKALTPIVLFSKRIIRKLGRFLIEPIVGEVNNYHLHVHRALDHTLVILERLTAEDMLCDTGKKKEPEERRGQI